MRHFSKNILQFNTQAIIDLKEIIRNETELDVKTKRFKYNKYLYPISVESFIDTQNLSSKTLGRFNSNTYTIELNYTYCSQISKEDYLNLLRHEFAHYLTYLKYGNSIKPHGVEFHQTCTKYNWDKEVSNATIELKKIDSKKQDKAQQIYKKLIALSKSDNIHEATLALEKANELILKHDFLNTETEQEYFVKSLCKFKRKNSKIDSIYHIMQEMNFGLIFHYGNEFHNLETFGTRQLIKQSIEVFNFLNCSLDEIWKSKKKETKLKGLVAKNSFFYGFSKGVLSNLQDKKKRYSDEQKSALIKLELLIRDATQIIYGNTSKIGTSAKSNSKAESIGFNSGKSFNTNFKKHSYLT